MQKASQALHETVLREKYICPRTNKQKSTNKKTNKQQTTEMARELIAEGVSANPVEK